MDMSGFEGDARRRATSALHEEIGQALTALRANNAFVLRQTAARPDLHAAARDVEIQGAQIARSLHALLHPAPLPEEGGEEGAQALQPQLHELLKNWQDSPRQLVCCRLEVRPAHLVLPRDLSLTLCRMIHAALQHIARQALTRPVSLSVRVADDDPAMLRWELASESLCLAASLPLATEGAA